MALQVTDLYAHERASLHGVQIRRPVVSMRFIPNAISVFRIAVTPAIVVCLFQEGSWIRVLAWTLFLLAVASDYLDGYLARAQHAQSRLGAFLDPMADKVLVLGTFTALIWIPEVWVPWWAVLLIALRDFGVTGLRTAAEASGRSLRTSRWAKTKTGLQLGYLTAVLLLWALAAFPRSADWAEAVLESAYLSGALVVVIAVTVLTGLHYLIRRELVKS